MNVASKHESDLFKKLKEYATDEIRDELDKKVKKEKLQSFNSYLYAEKAGCAHMYDSMYRIESASIHTTPRCLEHYVETDEAVINCSLPCNLFLMLFPQCPCAF